MRDRKTEIEVSDELRKKLQRNSYPIVIPNGDGTFKIVGTIDVVKTDGGNAILLS